VIKSADFVGQKQLEPSSTAEFIADKICRFINHVSYKNQPIFCCPIKLADVIVYLSSALL